MRVSLPLRCSSLVRYCTASSVRPGRHCAISALLQPRSHISFTSASSAAVHAVPLTVSLSTASSSSAAVACRSAPRRTAHTLQWPLYLPLSVNVFPHLHLQWTQSFTFNHNAHLK